MSDNLRVTVPVSPNDGISRLRPQKEPSNVESLTPERVIPPNQRDQANQGNSFDALMNRDSVFTKFIQQLRQTPELSETLQKVMFDIFNRKQDLRIGGAVNTLFRQLSEAMEMDKAEILENLLFQQTNSTKFSGPVFDLFRGMQKQFEGTDFELHLAHFLKAYDGFFSMEETSKSIANELETLQRQIPRSSAELVKHAAQELNFEQPILNVEKNLAVLKEKVIPVLGEYVSRTNDFGRARSTITLLVHDIARLNISSREALAEKFGTLLDFCRYGLNLPKAEIEKVPTLFAKAFAQRTDGQENKLVDSLIKLLQDRTTQQHLKSSGMGQSIFKDASTALLMDQSVYMPFTHMFLPVNYQGHFMFSELWVEKDGANSSQTMEDEPASKQMYLTFDIEDLGLFEAAITVKGKDISMNLTCPSDLPENRREITENLNQIFTQNGLHVDRLQVALDQNLQIEQQVMQKIYEGRNTVDVII